MELPIYPKPADDETLHSYVSRLASANAVRPETLTNILELPFFWKFNADAEVEDRALEAIFKITGHHITNSRNSIEIPHLHFDAYSAFTMALGKRGRGIPVCPLCLSTKGYYRRQWRYSPYVICELHGTLLIEKCPNCQARTKGPDGVTDAARWNTCRKCKSEYPPSTGTVEVSVNISSLISLQEKLELAFLGKDVAWGSAKLRSEEFLNLLYISIMSVIYKSQPFVDRFTFNTYPIEKRLRVINHVATKFDQPLVEYLWGLRLYNPTALWVLVNHCKGLGRVDLSIRPLMIHYSTYVKENMPFHFSNNTWSLIENTLPPNRPGKLRDGKFIRTTIENWINLQLYRERALCNEERSIESRIRAGFSELFHVGIAPLVIDAMLIYPSCRKIILHPKIIQKLLVLGYAHSGRIWREYTTELFG